MTLAIYILAVLIGSLIGTLGLSLAVASRDRREAWELAMDQLDADREEAR